MSGSRLLIITSILSVFFFIATVIFVVAFSYYFIKYNEREPTKNKICNTRDCVLTATTMAKKMNMSADPCVDFNEFACGLLFSSGPIPDIDSTNVVVILSILKEEIKQGEPSYLTKVKLFYKSCMDQNNIEKIGLTPFLADSLAKDWPTIKNNWTGVTFNLSEVNARYHLVDVTPFYSYFVDVDSKNSSKKVLYLDHPSLGIPQEYFKRQRNDTAIMAYQKYLADIAVELGASRDVADQDAKDVVDLQVALSKIITKGSRDANQLYNPVTLTELSILYPELDICRALRAAFSKAKIVLSNNQTVINQFPTYLGNISRILKQFSNRTLHNFFGFTYAVSTVGSLTMRLRQATLELDKVLRGIVRESERWQVCVDVTLRLFSSAMGKQYVTRTFSEEAKTYMEEMVDNLKKAFKQMIVENTWLGQATKDEAYKKLAAMASKIGYPNVNFQEKDIEAEYTDYIMNETTYYANLLVIYRRATMKQLLSLRTPINLNTFNIGLFEVNALYEPSSNSITFPAGILQPPSYSPSYPDFMNYGAIGSVIGHEITHGYDDTGLQFDAAGNLRNWWQKSDLDNFQSRTQCIINQTSAIFVKEINMNLNGFNTQGENMADYGGIKESFRAYKDMVGRKGEQLTLPELGLTQDQSFFLAYSQMWCEKLSNESLINQVTTGVHLPGKFRINGVLQNSEDFAKAYNCPRGSYMNPEKKCSVW